MKAYPNELVNLANEYPPKRKTSNVRVKYPKEFDTLVKLTSFLPSTATTSQRLWHVRNNSVSIPICKTDGCNQKTKWYAAYSDYAEYCSKKCYNKQKTINATQRIHQANVKKYGDDYINLSEKEKRKITNLKRYGVDNPFKDVEKIKKCNREMHGVDYHFQKHLSQDTLKLLNDVEWLYEMNHIQQKSCTEIADLLGVNNTTVNKAMYRLGIVPNYNYADSYHERMLADEIESMDMPAIKNDRSIISPYELDIYLPNHSIAIEYCGLYWHNELNKDKNYHYNKMKMCANKGIQLITLFEDEWHDKSDIVKAMIAHKANIVENTVYARQCEIKYVNSTNKKHFFEKTHIQGNGPSSVNVGLYFKNELVACMGFFRQKNDILILNRFSTSIPVVGGFSKLLNFVKKQRITSKIVTFADLRFSKGDLYEKMGFKKEKELPPDYYYVLNNKRYHKFNFRHKNLKKLLNSSYDEKASEHTNCYNNKIYRIYDCGKIRYGLQLSDKYQ